MEILLRELLESDIDDEYCSWFINNDGHLDYYSGSGNIEFNREVILSNYKKVLKEKKSFFYIILDKDNGHKIGDIEIGPIDYKNKTSDLVCLIGNREYLGKGIATKAISLANEIAFSKYDVRRLHGGMYASNIASIKAYTRAGWKIEATLKGFYLCDNKAEDRVCVACFNPKYFD